MKLIHKRLIRYTAFYFIDATMAYGGFIVGFGIHVVNWPAFLGFMLLGRFLFHTLNAAFLRADIRLEVKGESHLGVAKSRLNDDCR